MTAPTLDADEPARRAAASAAVDLLHDGMTIGLGSGRGVARVIDAIAARWPVPPLRAVCASNATETLARAAGIELLELDGEVRPELAIDGADEVDDRLALIKGGGAALLREKLVVDASDRFVVVAEAPKRVERLGARHPLPVEVVRFAWPETRRRVRMLLPGAEIRTHGGKPVVTDEGHYLLDGPIPPGVELAGLARELKCIVGVVEHGLFLDLAQVALIGTREGSVERLEA